MLNESRMEFVRTRGSKFGRFLMGFLFFASALSMLLGEGGLAQSAGYFKSLGIPMAEIVVWLVFLLKLGAGGLIMYGKKYVTESAAALIVFTLIATLLAHMNFADPMQMTAALKNLAIVGGLLYLMAFGPGGMNVKGENVT
jgi:putative oxidoreductase